MQIVKVEPGCVKFNDRLRIGVLRRSEIGKGSQGRSMIRGRSRQEADMVRARLTENVPTIRIDGGVKSRIRGERGERILRLGSKLVDRLTGKGQDFQY